MLQGSEVKMNFVLYRPAEEDAKDVQEETKGLSLEEGKGSSLKDVKGQLLEESKGISFVLEEVEMQDMAMLSHWDKKKHFS
jgi:hypothetical protein